MPLIDRGEGAHKPDAKLLQSIGSQRDIRGNCRDHSSKHDADNRHDERRPQCYSAQKGEENHGAYEGEGHGNHHLHQHRSMREKNKGKEQAQTGPFGGAGCSRFHEAVLREQLHHETAHSHGRTSQDEGDGARNARGEEHGPAVLVIEDAVLPHHEGQDEQRDDAEHPKAQRPGQDRFAGAARGPAPTITLCVHPRRHGLHAAP